MAVPCTGTAICESIYFLLLFGSFFDESLFFAVAVAVVLVLPFGACWRELLPADTFVFFINTYI